MGPNVRVSGSEPSLDAFSKRSDVISSIKFHSLGGPPPNRHTLWLGNRVEDISLCGILFGLTNLMLPGTFPFQI